MGRLATFGAACVLAAPLWAQSLQKPLTAAGSPPSSATARLLGSETDDDGARDRRPPRPGMDSSESRGPRQQEAEGEHDADGDDEVDEPLYKDFSRYLRETTGQLIVDALPIKRNDGKAPKLPDSYVLGGGDQIEVQAWGSISVQHRLTLDDSGRVFIPDVGSVQLAGVKASDLSNVLAGHFRRIYKGFELRALVTRARAITVYVAGQANSVGLKNVGASHTLLSATLGFARPSNGGSRRFVSFQHGKEAPRTIDLYCFFRDECPALPETLSDGDVIRIPSRAKLVAIGGAVSRPGIYELAEGETKDDLLRYAGGLGVAADGERTRLYSFTGAGGSGQRDFRQVSLAAECGSAGRGACVGTLQDGDFLDVQTRYAMVRNAVTVVVPKVEPIKVPFKPGLKLAEALQLPTEQLMPAQAMRRLNSGSFDALNELDDSLRPLDFDSISLLRFDREGREYQSQRVSLTDARKDLAGPANVLLQEGDVLVLDDVSDWKVRRDTMKISVRLIGEVDKPGRYRLPGNGNLADLLKMAGGIMPTAAPWSAVILRQGSGRNSINREVMDRAFSAIQDYQDRQEQFESGRQIAGTTRLQPLGERQPAGGSGTAGSLINSRLQNELIQLMQGRDLIYLSNGAASRPQPMALYANDIVIIPPQQDTFSCHGAVFKPGEFYVGSEPVSTKEALSRCGLIEEMGNNVYQFIARENRVCNTSWFSSCPAVRGGDMIVAVPESVTKQGAAAALQWLDVTLRSLTALATVKVLSD